MPSISKCFVLVSLALSVSALTTPHAIRNAHNHHHHSAATPSALSFIEPVVIPMGTPAARTVRRRSTSGRCKPKSSSTSHTASTPPANVGHAPPTVTTHHSSSPIHKTTHTSSADKPTSSKTGGGTVPSFMVGIHVGQGTYYGTGLGACGITNNDNQPIVAVSHLLFDNYPGYNGANPNKNPVCGKKLTATYQGKSTTVTVMDRCVGCQLLDLDFSPSSFSQLANQAVGRISGMTWTWDE